MDYLERTERLIGEAALERLKNSHVLIAGIGGVGSYVVEALVRSGIGKVTLYDDDVVECSNINRQLQALHSTIGQLKVEAMSARLLDINPRLICQSYAERIGEEFQYSGDDIDYLVDCVDDVNAKIALISWADVYCVPVISAMGTGNQIDNRQLRIADIKDTSHCPLARVLRKKLRERGLTGVVKTCYSALPPAKKTNGAVGTLVYVPATAGLTIAGEVIRDLINFDV